MSLYHLMYTQPPKDIAKEGQESLEEEDQEPIPTTPLPKEWVCLGSDKEILESMLTLTRPLVSPFNL